MERRSNGYYELDASDFLLYHCSEWDDAALGALMEHLERAYQEGCEEGYDKGYGDGYCCGVEAARPRP